MLQWLAGPSQPSAKLVDLLLLALFSQPQLATVEPLITSDVHGLASGHELDWAELFWAGLSQALEAAHQGLRPSSGKVKARAGGLGCG